MIVKASEKFSSLERGSRGQLPTCVPFCKWTFSAALPHNAYEDQLNLSQVGYIFLGCHRS